MCVQKNKTFLFHVKKMRHAQAGHETTCFRSHLLLKKHGTVIVALFPASHAPEHKHSSCGGEPGSV